ncbi:hypothetical protein IID22_02715 [Patescibacteria group bacterium]|nr:hypothetical protein [Patescibacteria group bacterium]
MATINLLPKDLTPKESFVKLASTLKRASIIGFIALIVLALALLGGFAVLSRQLTTSSDDQSSLKSKIVALETTEQRLVLLQDRLERIDHDLAIDTASDEIEQLEKLTDLLPEGVTLQEVNLSPTSSTVAISTANSKTLSQFLAILLGSNIYAKVTLNSLSFNYLSGYSASLTLTN